MDPIRITKTIKIGNREFTVQELTVREIINLVSGSVFYREPVGDGGNEADVKTDGEESVVDWSLFKEFSGIGTDLEKMMSISCVDFKLEDLIDMAPSSIRKVVDAFNEVNNDFLSVLKALGVAEALSEIRDAALSRFSKMLVTLSKMDT